MIYKKFDIVVVPFPFVDSPLSKPRPAVVLSDSEFQERNHHLHLGMITTGYNTQWADDMPLSSLAQTGLSISSVFRPKIFTLPESLIKKKIGKLCSVDADRLERIM